MASISLKLSKKEGIDGKSQIIAILTITPTKRPYFKTGIFVKKDYFKETKTKRGCSKDIVIPKKGKLNNEEYQDVCNAKQQLQEYCMRIEKVCFEGIKILGFDGITKEWIEKFLRISQSIDIEEISIKRLLDLESELRKRKEKKRSLPSFYELGEIYLEQKGFSTPHKKSFRVLMRDIRRYELFVQKTQNKSFKINIESITKDTVRDIDSYIINEYNLSLEYPKLFEKLLEECPIEISKKHKSPKLTVRGNNTIVKLRKKFRAFFKWLNDEEYTSNNPFEGFCIGSEKYGDPIYIDTNERDTIANYDMSADPTLAIQRDVFVLQCLIGCRVGDYYRLTNKNIIDNSIVYTPNKTKKRQNRHR